MPRGGALTLSDVKRLFLWIGRELRGLRGRDRVSRLMETYGDDAPPTLLDTLTGLAKQGHARFSDRSRALYVTLPEQADDAFRALRFTRLCGAIGAHRVCSPFVAPWAVSRVTPTSPKHEQNLVYRVSATRLEFTHGTGGDADDRAR